MRARAAYGSGLTPDRARVARNCWDRAVAGDSVALRQVAGWIGSSGISIAALARAALNGQTAASDPQTDPGTDLLLRSKTRGRPPVLEDAFCRALAQIGRLSVSTRPIQPAQIVVARYGDFALATDPRGPAVRWTIRTCGSYRGGVGVLSGADLAAWRMLVKTGRSALPSADDPLLAPRPDGVEWTARAVRYAMYRGGFVPANYRAMRSILVLERTQAP